MIAKTIRVLYKKVKTGQLPFIGFGIVGSIGAVINIMVYTICKYVFLLNINTSAIIAFVCAVTNNYNFNHKWTFASRTDGDYLKLNQYFAYFLGNIVGLFINLIILNYLVNNLGEKYNIFYQIAGMISGMAFNFLFAKTFVFKKKYEK